MRIQSKTGETPWKLILKSLLQSLQLVYIEPKRENAVHSKKKKELLQRDSN